MAESESPCVRNCCLDSNDICLGCFRSMDEIMMWSKIDTTVEQKKQILCKAKQRQQSRQNLSEKLF